MDTNNPARSSVHVISLGGSLIVPDTVDTGFLSSFKKAISEYLEEDKKRKLILVCGGGATARKYQKAYLKISPNAEPDELDWIGIRATRINAELVKNVFKEYTADTVVTNPTAVSVFAGRILVASGWKPGFSTDYDSVILAEKFFASTIINLSNIEKVYSDDPKKNPDAVPIERITWHEFQKLVGEEWKPGINVPFDPVASKKAAKNGLKVIIASGANIKNLINILNGRDFIGTSIVPA